MKKNKLIALFAGLSLAFVSSAALAAPSADTLLVAGYDSDQMAVLYGVSDIDQEGDDVSLDCTVVEGEYVYALNNGEEVEDGTTEVDVTGLWEKDEAAEDVCPPANRGDQPSARMRLAASLPPCTPGWPNGSTRSRRPQ